MGDGWPMSIRELYVEGEIELGPGADAVCGWSGCLDDPGWEVGYEDLSATENAGERSGQKNAVMALQNIRYYCDEHARRFCLDGDVELAMKLVI
jgi:hypothetical protein